MATKTATNSLARNAAKATAKARAAAQRPTINAAEVQLLTEELAGTKEAAKALYAKADEIEARLIALIGDETVILPNGKAATVCDNFLDKKTGLPKNKAFRIAGISRFEVVVK